MEQVKAIRVISTRFLGADSVLFAKRQGWLVDIYPMIETVFSITPQQVDEIIEELSKPLPETILVISSSQAVRALNNGFTQRGQVFPAGTGACFVGQKTADLASELLHTKNVFTADHADELVALSGGLKGKSFLFVSGHKRMNTIPEGLKAKGCRVLEYKVYDTVQTPLKIEGDFRAVLFFSPSAVDSFFKLNKWNGGRLAVSIGETTAAALRNHGVDKVVVAGKPGEIETMQALASYMGENK
jgi:uroporphyrinogen-III synthase